MGSLIMPKHTGVVSEFQTPLKVCYDRKDINNGWVESGNAKQGIDGFTLYLYNEYHTSKVPGHSTPKNDNSDYTKDAQMPLYFGFMEITDSRTNTLRRITQSGIEMYEALVSDNKDKVYSLFIDAMERITFGRNNSGCENSDSDLEAPNILLLSSVILSGIKRKEYYYILSYMNENNCDLSNALSKVAYYRRKNEDIPDTALTYTDVKFIPFWVSIGFLFEDADKRLHISKDVFDRYASRIMRLRIKNTEVSKKNIIYNPDGTIQKIYYGCPGTGKSFKIKKEIEGIDGELAVYFDDMGNKIDTPDTKEERMGKPSNIFRTTFHPDYDYSNFVGSYKPVMKKVDGSADGNNTQRELEYDFVPQVFTKAYIRAYKSKNDNTLSEYEKQVYIIIEEINRGNCAQIFGDLFQLLDRKDGVSEYPIIPDTELINYLNENGIPGNSIRLTENLHILATMNTSDQSLFPMDSAFKRRWAMEYVPINLEQEKAMTYTFEVKGQKYSWVGFLRKVNPLIRKATDSEDKQMGEFFIKGQISEDDFKNKVMFYIWNDVCKDLYSATRISQPYFMRFNDDLDGTKNVFTFAELYGKGHYDEDTQQYTEPSDLLEGFITKKLGLEPINVQKQE
ncbi:MAG: AAA family ATPase [Bacteroidales bacterium]|nr:AAA family ATPase [Bacteroidales bacterium]MDD7119204.1 AAA family ATPase [Bacteroidales bacterium]MDY5443447.1 AAA family ATPase [Candidatus Cryptobacteroides sp.]